ncbi:hypothetical protein EDD22DRAFT_1052706 [Suillus occidentalis]|nr:hypothetical protein EDD22DRAFT_1052706 [Suillus occidentalis]
MAATCLLSWYEFELPAEFALRTQVAFPCYAGTSVYYYGDAATGSSALAWALKFMVVLSFWWKHLIVTVRCLILGTLEQPFRDLIPSENFDSQLDEKPSELNFRMF